MKIFDKLFGTHSERELKLITPVIDRIEDYIVQIEIPVKG